MISIHGPREFSASNASTAEDTGITAQQEEEQKVTNLNILEKQKERKMRHLHIVIELIRVKSLLIQEVTIMHLYDIFLSSFKRFFQVL